MAPIRVGVAGRGEGDRAYAEGIARRFSGLEIAGFCSSAPAADPDAVAPDMTRLLRDPGIDIIMNLAAPSERYRISMAAIQAGKHVYSEHPLASTFEEGESLLEAARKKNVALAAAPDTFMGAGIQTCRKLLDDGYIGAPAGAAAHLVCPWEPGGDVASQLFSPMQDSMMALGAYYITALVSLLGSVGSVTGMSGGSRAPGASGPAYVAGLMRFECGAVGSIMTTFDAHLTESPRIELYGSQGTLCVPDPLGYGADVKLYRPESGVNLRMPLVIGTSYSQPGVGLADMAEAISAKRAPRASGELACHVLEIIEGIQRSGGFLVEMTTRTCRPDSLTKSRFSEMFEG